MDMSQVELARRIGRHQTAIGPYERDEYEPPRDVVEKLALVLETSPEYLYFGRSPPQMALPVVGRHRPCRAARAAAGEPAGADQPARRAAARLPGRSDDSMAPVFRPRQIALVARAGAERTAASCSGRDALVELADGRTLLRRLMPSARPDRFDLAAYNAPPSTDGAWSRGEIHCRCLVARSMARDSASAMLSQEQYPLRLMRNSSFAGSLKNRAVF